ncbi:MAG: UvrB/UvrC motif-containing protein [Candidatus Nomurabacteria bacterium]|nr:UvrB/UvrC motif-containing protein [Candidatus Nomurabacteria bacterium]
MQKANFGKLNMPDKPGVYFFIKGKEILYIGKATSLKDRVKSYFGADLIETRGPLLVDMVFKAGDIKWQETDSVLEALILEANLIKKHQPYYNTKEKDDKSFNYVCITKEELPRVLIERGKNLVKENYSKVYGPFPNGLQLRTALELVRKIFPFLDEKSRIKGTYEFYRQIKLAPEQKEILLKNIKNIKLFFEGKKKSILRSLEKEMKLYAKQKEFEKAGEVKRQIFALKHINDVALIKGDVTGGERLDLGDSRGPTSKSPFRIEAYDIAHMSGKNMVGVMVVLEGGEVNKNEYRKFKIKTQKDANDTGALKEVLERRFNHPEWRFPDVVVLDGSTAQINVAQKVLKDLHVQAGKNIKVEVVAVTKDERHKAKEIKGDSGLVKKYKNEILLANSEAHRFAINYHKNMRARNFLK